MIRCILKFWNSFLGFVSNEKENQQPLDIDIPTKNTCYSRLLCPIFLLQIHSVMVLKNIDKGGLY